MTLNPGTATSVYRIGDLPQRLIVKIVPDPVTGCWLWQGRAQGQGYGQITWHGSLRTVHRLVYELLAAPIPAGLQLDHVKARGCRYRNCCWPYHLEPVTPGENVRRAYADVRLATHCRRGHEYTPGNSYYAPRRGQTTRECKTCRIIAARECKRRQRARMAAAAAGSMS